MAARQSVLTLRLCLYLFAKGMIFRESIRTGLLVSWVKFHFIGVITFVSGSRTGGQRWLDVADTEYGSTDNCGIASMSLDKSTFTCAWGPTKSRSPTAVATWPSRPLKLSWWPMARVATPSPA